MMHISRRDSEQLMAFSEVKESLEKRGMLTVSDIAKAMQVGEERVLELMELVEIDRPMERMKLYPHNFSGGMRQRAVMAIALAARAKILLAERRNLVEKAFTYLDATEQRILRERFWRHRPQSVVAESLGVSQMYISRAERRILKKLRAYME